MTLVEWLRDKGVLVKKGEVIAVLETSKASFDLQAEQQGYFTPLAESGTEIKVGQVIAALTATQDEEVHLPEELPVAVLATAVQPKSWTKKAELLAQKYKIDIAKIAETLGKESIGEADVEAFAKNNHAPAHETSDATDLVNDVYVTNRQQRILLIGAGLGAAIVADIIARTPQQRLIGILDDNPKLQDKRFMGSPILGKIAEVPALWERGAFDTMVIAISTLLKLRADLYEKFSAMGIPFANVIDPTVSICSNVQMGQGNIIFGFCRIGACTFIGNNNFISAYTNIEHHNTLGSHCTFGPGVLTSGDVKINDRVKFGTGIFIEPHLTIGANSVVSSGVVLTTNVPDNSIVKAKANFSIQPLK
jgi:sugar O-acyltransferase (sialic acid O-acetyltransferase NeuD family)